MNLDANYQTRGLIESWDPAAKRWRIDDVPQPGAERDLFFGASALSRSDVWAVGEQQSADGTFGTLVEHWNGTTWSVVPSPNPGTVGNHLYAVVAYTDNNVWAVGQRNGQTSPDHELILHWNGATWSVVPTPSHGAASAALYALTSDSEGGLWAVGETVDVVAGGQPLIEHLQLQQGEDGASVVGAQSAGSPWATLWGAAFVDGVASAVGTVVNVASGANQTLVLSGQEDGFHVVGAPNPSTDTALLGAATSVGHMVWAVGHFRPTGPRAPLIMRHPGQ